MSDIFDGYTSDGHHVIHKQKLTIGDCVMVDGQECWVSDVLALKQAGEDMLTVTYELSVLPPDLDWRVEEADGPM